MYNLALDKDRLTTYIGAFDANIKLLCKQIGEAPNSMLALRNLGPSLLKINAEIAFLDSLIDKVDKEAKIIEDLTISVKAETSI